jgi:hypothetical protein
MYRGVAACSCPPLEFIGMFHMRGQLVTGYCYGWYRTKRPLQLRSFPDLLCSLSLLWSTNHQVKLHK